MGYKLRAVVQDEDGRYVTTGVPFNLRWNTFEEARDDVVPILKAIAQTLDLVYTNEEEDVWFELFDERWGAVAWEVRAKDCSTLQPLNIEALPF